MQRRLARVFRPFERFFRLEAAGGIVLLGATLLALAWANSAFFPSYSRLWDTKFVIGLGPWVLQKALILWVNDGLMAIFFLLVGLEIKRELVAGELSTRRSATLPVIAALGGMVVPALIYLAATRGTPVADGWAIPMATDIAFALGALAVLARRIPPALRIFLAATAIVDDIGAVLVIAFVYTPTIGWTALGVAAAATVALVLLNRAGVTRLSPYMILGVVLWVAFLKSGVHATVAGVVLAFTIPAKTAQGVVRAAGDDGASGAPTASGAPIAEQGARDAEALAAEHAYREASSPLARLEHGLVPWVSFGIVPVFALANAGVRLEGSLVETLSAPLSIGIILGLVLGKQIGLLLFPWGAVRAGIAGLPPGVTWRHVWGVAWLGGIGFTMSLFISGLALPLDELANGKIAILTASVIAALGGFAVLATGPKPRKAEADPGATR